ncbi:MAG: polysaccharide deacetylase family protein [Flavobacteriales bacterium]|nr:polysaccharide deacetylase family protein [Flavobacteriales bacterium]
MSVLIFCDTVTNRLRYITKWIFDELSNFEVDLTTDLEQYELYAGPKINYSKQFSKENKCTIIPADLLSKSGVDCPDLSHSKFQGVPILFSSNAENTFPFDIFSATFYLITRIEEYDNTTSKDAHQRFKAENSVAAKNNFLDLPIVDIWIDLLFQHLNNSFESKIQLKRSFQQEISFDIDIAYKYKGKGLMRTLWGFAKDGMTLNSKEVLNRYAVLTGRAKDPFDCFEFLKDLQSQYQFQLQYFFLIGDFGEYDRNISHRNNTFQKLIKTQSDYHDIGLHLSYKAYNNPNQMKIEFERLQKITLKLIRANRNHYIKLSIPKTYVLLEQLGIKDDYTMGYPDTFGFRAGTCSSFPFFNLHQNRQTNLRIHPFCTMDAAAIYYSNKKQDEILEEMLSIKRKVRKVNGTLSTAWHNHFYHYSNTQRNIDWQQLFLEFIKSDA